MTQTTLNMGVLAVVISLLGLGMHAKSANAQRTLLSTEIAYGVSAPANAADAMPFWTRPAVAAAHAGRAVVR